MTDQKRKPGRPRKWSSDAERMRASRAATLEKRLADEERREVKRGEKERATREQFASSPNAKPVPAAGAPKTGDTWKAVHATCEANILKLRDEVRALEDEYDDSVYDRWILEHQYRMAVARMQEHDPDGIAWLDEQVRRWESRRAAIVWLDGRRLQRQRGPSETGQAAHERPDRKTRSGGSLSARRRHGLPE